MQSSDLFYSALNVLISSSEAKVSLLESLKKCEDALVKVDEDYPCETKLNKRKLKKPFKKSIKDIKKSIKKIDRKIDENTKLSFIKDFCEQTSLTYAELETLVKEDSLAYLILREFLYVLRDIDFREGLTPISIYDPEQYDLKLSNLVSLYQSLYL